MAMGLSLGDVAWSLSVASLVWWSLVEERRNVIPCDILVTFPSQITCRRELRIQKFVLSFLIRKVCNVRFLHSKVCSVLFCSRKVCSVWFFISKLCSVRFFHQKTL